MKKLVLGILAHVDAGKTTLSEAMLYTCGSIRNLGRVDHKNTSLDNHELEKARGITIFSKQAQLRTDKMELCLLDTPGHVDFSAETERSLQVLDAAVLVISGTDGVQAHTETLWRLLQKHGIPVMLFVTKMDLAGADRQKVLADLRDRISENCVDFCAERDEQWCETAAMCDEETLEAYMESGRVSDEDITRLVAERKLFPVLFGSGLKLEGVKELIELIESCIMQPQYGDTFGARVFKILRDGKGNRLSCMKITGGSLKNRDEINGEKITGIRIYSGAKYESVDEVTAGSVCAVQGLSNSFPGQGLGFEGQGDEPLLEPVMSYRINLPKGVDARTALPKLKQLEDEDPMLRIMWNEQLRQIRVQLMGKVQTEVLCALIKERFDMDVTMELGGIMYRETVKAPVLGVGHFEPLRHYAEVHLVLEPMPPGSGVSICSDCPEDMLSREWQQSILGSLASKEHKGVLTGSPITDIRIRLIAGRAHVKHTEGGDFREAACRAVRQGLMKAENILLVPWYEIKLEVPPEQIGRAISDIRAMSGEFETEGSGVIHGFAPVSELNGYAAELASYTSGKGRLVTSPAGYRPCHNTQTVLEGFDYDPEADLDNTPDSVFCSHGAGMTVKWSEVNEHMHIDTGYGREKAPVPVYRPRNFSLDDKELEAIMEREFGPIRRREYAKPVRIDAQNPVVEPTKREHLIVDGYNLLFAFDELNALAKDDLALARERLTDMLKSYRGFKDCELVLVFDGYKVEGNHGERETEGIHIVYTKENETADMYIEKLANDIGKNYAVRVITNDSLIRLSALRSGVLRMSSGEFINELKFVREQISGYLDGKR